MATKLTRLEFKQRYNEYSRGMFIAIDGKRFPKDQVAINLGERLSEMLLQFSVDERKEKARVALESIVSAYKGVTLTNIEVLFTPYLSLDVIGVLASLCRNRKICVLWPGKIENGKAYYAEPAFPENYECELSRFQETFIIE